MLSATTSRSGGPARPARGVGVRPPRDATGVEIGLDDARGGDQLGIARDRSPPPSRCTTARRPRSRPGVCPWNLPNSITWLAGHVERRRRRPAEVTEPVALERSGRRRGARRLAAAPARRAAAAGRAGSQARRVRPARPGRAGRLVARSERLGRVDAPGHRSGRFRPRRSPASPRRRCRFGAAPVGPASSGRPSRPA